MLFTSQLQNLVVSPLEQFEVLNLTNLNFFIFSTNAQFFLLLTFITVSLFYINYNQNNLLVPATTQYLSYVLETLFQELLILIYRNVGLRVGQLYFPWFVFIFLTVGGLNLIGMIPYTFTVTSHIVATFALSFTLFVGINIRAVMDKGFEFFALFLPSGAPVAIAPFLVIIELISYIARVFSLAIRLFANLMAGHSLLKILIGFAFTIGAHSLTGSWPLLIVAFIPFLVVFVITFLEVAIALLQGYVFTVLMALYVKDLHVAH